MGGCAFIQAHLDLLHILLDLLYAGLHTAHFAFHALQPGIKGGGELPHGIRDLRDACRQQTCSSL